MAGPSREFDWAGPEAARQGIRAGLAHAVIVVPADLKGRVQSAGSARLPILYDSADSDRGRSSASALLASRTEASLLVA